MSIIAAVLFIAVLFIAPFFEKRLWKFAPICLFAVYALSTELFIFNAESFISPSYDKPDYEIAYSSGVTEEAGGYTVTSPSDYIEFNIAGGTTKNIYVDTEAYMTRVNIYASDESSASRYYAGGRQVSTAVKQSEFIKLNLSGASKNIRLYFPDIKNPLKVKSVALNAERPVFFSFFRFTGIILLLLAIYYILLNKKLWEIMCDSSKAQRYIAVGAAIMTGVIFLGSASLNPSFTNPGWTHHHQYDMLASSLLEGRVDIDYSGAEILNSLDNPYDMRTRWNTFSEKGSPQPWDVSFFEGKFYVYFGVLPVLLFYMPARLITGNEFPNFMGVVIFSWLLIAMVFLLCKKLIDMYFKKTPFVMYILLCEATLFAGGTFYLIKRPDFYSIPIMGGVAFVTAGLYFWVSAVEKGELSWRRLCVGSVFMAFVSMLRPNLLFFAAAAFVIFFKSVFKDRELLSINSRLTGKKYSALRNTVVFCLPFIIVGVTVMVYNYMRFSSPFDFGAAYNLTSSDMTKRGVVLDRWGLGVFEYLFKFPNFGPIFPWLKTTSYETMYVGFTSYESMYGGLFTICPLLWAYGAVGKAKKSPVFPLAVFMGVMSFITVLLDIQAGGILPRYQGDFTLFFALGAAMIVLALAEKYPSAARGFVSTASVFIAFYAFCLLFADGSNTIGDSSPALYMNFYCMMNPFM